MGDADVATLKARLSLLEGVDCEQMGLFCSGSPLEDEMQLAALSGLNIDLTVPLLGGKVHGSLARAGKVRGQTPKVEAQEKKKKKTGRAKRRIQYNRRLSTLSRPSDARRVPTPTPKCDPCAAAVQCSVSRPPSDTVPNTSWDVTSSHF